MIHRTKIQTLLLIALALPALALPALALAAEARRGALVDLTHAFGEDTIAWPTSEPFEFIAGFRGDDPAGYYYEAHSFRTAEHVGTHLDAPVHFFRGGAPTEAVPLDRLVGPGLVIDVSEQCARDRSYLVTVEDILAWEREHGRTVDGHIVLVHTGFGAFWPDAERYLGMPCAARRAWPRSISRASIPTRHAGWDGNDASAPSASTRRASTTARRSASRATWRSTRAAFRPSRTSRTSMRCPRRVSR